MFEERKLKEAQRFYDLMTDNIDDREAFEDFLSAFLCAARSVLQYAIEEERLKTGTTGTPWYDSQVSQNEIIKFFKDKRDANVHKDQPVRPQTHYDVNIHIPVAVAVAVAMQTTDGSASNEKDKTSSNGHIETSTRYSFLDWGDPATNDVLVLCRVYIDELQTFIEEGKQAGIITE